MASGLLRSMLSYILTDSTFTGVSKRSKLALQQTEDLLKKVSEEAYYIDHFHGFAVQLVFPQCRALRKLWQPKERCYGRCFMRKD